MECIVNLKLIQYFKYQKDEKYWTRKKNSMLVLIIQELKSDIIEQTNKTDEV